MKLWWANGYLCGALMSYLVFALPRHVQQLRDRKARRIRAEIDRITGGFTTHLYTPIQPPPSSLRERFLEWCCRWRDDWREGICPLTPEKVAEQVYLREARDRR